MGADESNNCVTDQWADESNNCVTDQWLANTHTVG